MAESNDNVNETPEPEEISSEDVVGGQETPSADALDREQAIVDETPGESEIIAAEETSITNAAEAATGDDEELEYIEEDETPRVKPAIPGMDLEVDIVREGDDRPRYSEDEDPDAEEETEVEGEEELPQTIADASIDLAAGARYRATGKRKTAVARVTLKPGTGQYLITGVAKGEKSLEEFFPRHTLQRTIRQPLETVGYEDRMDVVATMHGGGVSAQAGALRHGISKALLEADPNLRSELKRRGFLTRDARVKERKKAGLKKARKRPQFSKR
ncbi:small subunit ribosomal protein S9 [Solirubrobacter pauli]|uniref:Small ribosomal subunit protein uS9 n=2 Tax=Solirubrobacter pauli TaxID=166793 RepID=A0A660LH75_9ACTN|nr:small subunit ribosomal protein S9 [Solirubrobacter pauli]